MHINKYSCLWVTLDCMKEESACSAGMMGQMASSCVKVPCISLYEVTRYETNVLTAVLHDYCSLSRFSEKFLKQTIMSFFFFSFYSCRSGILCNQTPMKQWLTSGCVPLLPFPPSLPSPTDSERLLHLGLFDCLSVCLHRTCVFLCNCLWDWDEFFAIGANTHVACFNDKYNVIGHVVWQPYWKNGKTLTLCFSETAKRKKLKLGTKQVLLMGNECDFYYIIVALIMTSWLHM